MLIFISRKGRKGRRTSNAKLRFRWSSRSLRATEVAKETETIGANTAPANCPSKLGGRAKRRGYALAPSDNSVDSRCNLLTSEIYLQKKKICVFCEFCVRKKYQREKWNIFHTESTEPTELFLRNEQNMCYHTGIRIHRICRRLRHDGWRDGNG